MSVLLQEKREHYFAKVEEFKSIMELAKDGPDRVDLSRKEVLEKLGARDEHDATQKLRARNQELEDLGRELRQAELKEYGDRNAQRTEELKTPTSGSILHPETGRGERKTIGKMYAESDQFKQFRLNKTNVPFHADVSLKTLFQTSAGFDPEDVRSGLIVPDATRPIQVTDLIPAFPISQSTFKYMEETTRTHSAAERAEGGTYAESAFVFTEQTSEVRSIGDSIPVTDEQLEDESQVQSLLDQRLRFGIAQRLDLQILVGDGIAPNLEGILNVTGIQTQALGTDDRITAFAKALTLVRFTGRAIPNGAVFHPNDWQAILLLKNANGDFLFGNPFMGGGPQSLLGIPIAQSDAITENTGLVGDFANFSRLDERRSIVIQVGFTGTQFVEGKKTLRGDLRTAFTITRPAAFCTITGI